MKTLIAAIVLMAGAVAQGQETRQSIAEIAVGGYFHNTEKAVLFDDGELVITTNHLIASGADSVAAHGDVVIASQMLNPTLFQTLLGHVRVLSKAKLDEQHSQVVCMMVAPAGPMKDLMVRRGYDWKSGEFEGSMKLILTQSGCWRSYHVKPADHHAQTAAHYLKGALVSLAQQLLDQ